MIKIYDERIFHIFTDEISYMFHVENGSIRNLYFGGAIDGKDAESLLSIAGHSSFDQDVRAEREEYAMWNGRSFHLPCLQAKNETGRVLFCKYKGYEKTEDTQTDQLELLLEDTAMGLSIRLRYTLYKDTGVLARNVSLTASKKVRLERVQSASVSLPPFQNGMMRWLTGKWAGEFRINEAPVETGIFRIQSKRGIPGPHYNPSIAIAEPGACETSGRVWFGVLAYSGNWSIEIEKSIFGNTHIVAGINDFDFEMILEAGQSFTTPDFYSGFTNNGFGGMSRIMHRFVREHIIPRKDLRPVLYNSWEATYFDVNVNGQKKLADKAAQIGCELFVVDDGWFGERHSDKAGLGDWRVNAGKFPNGLGELIDHVKSLGMKFGIWVEPESVNPDSDLYRAHPDWIYRYPDREPVQLRNQYLLNMSLLEVQDYLKQMLHDLLQNHDIAFVKWDMNRIITDPYSALTGEGKSLWHGHVQAVYDLWRYVRKNFPDVAMETCSGGGGRIDLGILRFAEQSWPSDNTDPYTRLFIQEGFTQFYPASIMTAWVTDSPGSDAWSKRPLSYRFHSSMCGVLGIGADITKFSEAELEECAKWIKFYKTHRHIIQSGDLYRLRAPREEHLSAVQYVSKNRDEVLLFIFVNGLTTDKNLPSVRLLGLDSHSSYKTDSGETFTGSTLMNFGVWPQLWGDFTSRVVYLKKEI